MESPLPTTLHPASSGFLSANLKHLDTLLQGYVSRGELSGMIAVVARNGQTAYYQKFGWMDSESQLPMRDDTIFRIASMTKPVTAVAAMMLYEAGHFHLNTPISTFFPGFKDVMVNAGPGDGPGEMELTPISQEVTFRHLFTHTAGLSYGWDENDPVDQLYQQVQAKYAKNGIPFTNQALAKELSRIPLAFQPGSHWRYSLSIDLIGALVEIISGKPLDQYLQENIFEPLGMVDTAFHVPQDKQVRVATLYGHTEEQEFLHRIDDQIPPTAPPSFISGGGGLCASVGDYARFCQMLVNGGELDGIRLLGPSTVEMFTINHCPPKALPYSFEEGSLYHEGYGYSLGTRVLMDVSKSGLYGSVGEFGWDGAFSTYFWIDLMEKLYGLLMLQHSPNTFYPIHQQFKQVTYQALSR